MKLPRLRNVSCIVWCLALDACVALGWYMTTPTLFNSYNSPHYVYRLEIYHASPWQRIVHRDQKVPSVVRLYRIDPRERLRESQVVDLAAGREIRWQLDPPVQASKVYVGKEVVFENIPQECTEAAQIPGCPNTEPPA
ncbi:hypothetical protein [Paracidovorax avenae]|uniref:hypothetical protein n=1 Tax=Paracidovorax avenae TaxID=80867 RepID=UPI000D21CA67|nr:hypothetical protein [Paracidovorax avenae]AVS86103.1 hypothetical protein C8239_16210 [Paracidovorax avenae]AVS96816.1 hypothetical protein C8232_11565 [Paracidovorax avenae]AVT03922.1 hypothetical protein C8243_16520 [Paracidovorax avenae]AVT10835.1 hypothetical protein C8242_16090 [Paracidovorax avenae]